MKLQTNADTAMLAAPNMVNPRTIAPTAPTAAPLDTPIMPGSARGFRKTPCSEAPATPKPPPTRMPRTTRGRRMFQRIASVRDSNEAPISIPAWLSRIESACAGGISTAPIPTFANNAATKSASITTSRVEAVSRGVSVRRLAARRSTRSGVSALAPIVVITGPALGPDEIPAAVPSALDPCGDRRRQSTGRRSRGCTLVVRRRSLPLRG